MATPNRYFGKGMHAAAEIKRVQHRVRQARPERFQDEVKEVTRMDKDGKVTVTDRVHVRVPTPRQRHELALKRL